MIGSLAVRVFFLSLFSVCLFGCASNPFLELDQIVQDTKTDIGMPSGTAVVMVRDDQIIHESYFGYADIENRIPVDERSVFYFASTTKALLGLVILILEEQNEITTDTTLQELFPELQFPLIDADSITVKHLLTHTSGIDNEPLTWGMSYTGLHGPSVHRLKMISQSYPSESAMLGEFEYSNIGYNILVTWMDEDFGRDWRETFTEVLLEPLNMTSTTGYVSLTEVEAWPMVQPYSYKVGDGKQPLYLRKTDETMYSVGLMSTARDYSKFLIATMNDGRIDGQQVFSPTVLQKQREKQVELETRGMDGYAWGWMTGSEFGSPLRFHTGGFSGTSVSISYLPDEKIGLVIVHNENGLKANVLSGIIQKAAYAIALGKSHQDIEAAVSDDIDWLKGASEDAKITLVAKAQERRSASWKGSLPIDQYWGTYTHPLSGDIVISAGPDGSLRLEWGLLKGEGFPTEDTDIIQVNFRPGSFDDLSFNVSNNRVLAAVFNGVEFDRQSQSAHASDH